MADNKKDIEKAKRIAHITAAYMAEMVELGAGTREFACVVATICDTFALVTGQDPSEMLVLADMIIMDGKGGVRKVEKK